MADNINKTISIDVEINNDGQQQITQYKAAFDSLRGSITGLSNPLSGLSNSINSLDQDISKLTSSINKLNDHNQDLSSGGDKVKSTITDLISSFGSWKTIVDLLGTSVEAFKIELTGGLAALTVFLPVFIKWMGELFKGNTTLSALNKTLKDTKIVADAVNQSRMQGIQSAQQELVNLKLLYKASQDHKVSITDRKKIVSELQNEYPDYLGNISAETILTGKATDNYNKLTNSIIAASRARAAENIITKNQERQLGNDDKLKKLTSDLTQYSSQLKVAQKEYNAYTSNAAIGSGTVPGDSEESNLYNKLAGIRDMVNETKQSISHLNTDSGLLVLQNEALAKTVIGDTEQNGARVVGVVANTNNQLAKMGSSALASQKSSVAESDKALFDSINKRLQATYSAYGKETTAENQRYNEEKAKLQKLLNDKVINQQQYNAISKQLETEYHTNISTIITKYNEQDKQRTEQSPKRTDRTPNKRHERWHRQTNCRTTTTANRTGRAAGQNRAGKC